MNKIYKFPNIYELQNFLNGGLMGKELGGTPQGWYGLVGLTLKFVGPGPTGSVTFTPSVNPLNTDPYCLQLQDIQTQVSTVVDTIRVGSVNGRILFIEVTPTNGVSVDSVGGGSTANTALGLDSAGAVGKVYAGPGTATPAVAPAWLWAYSVNENSHTLFCLE